MAFTAADVMARAAITLQDDDGVRWPAAELHGYLNDGVMAVVELKPTAKAVTASLALVAGTKQALPVQYLTIARVICNMVDDTTPGAAITPLESRALIDVMIPGWHDQTIVPYAKTVVHVVQDGTDPRTFHVIPGNTGAGKIMAVLGAMPSKTEAPAAPAGALISDYTGAVDLPDIFKNALVDYVLYRAYSKDARIAGSAARAQAHFELFRSTVGAIAAGEAAMSMSTAMMPQAG